MKRLTIDTGTRVPHDCFNATQNGTGVRIARQGNAVAIAADGFHATVTLRELARGIKRLIEFPSDRHNRARRITQEISDLLLEDSSVAVRKKIVALIESEL